MKKFRAGLLGQGFEVYAAQLGNKQGPYPARKLARWGFPRCGTGASQGASVSISSLSSGTCLRYLPNVLPISEGNDAGDGDEVAELERGGGHLPGLGKAVQNAANIREPGG